MEKAFEPALIEKVWYQRWEEAGLFASEPVSGRESFSIMLPPPNVTGTLHIGHAFQYTLMDLMCRYKRMQGAQVLWQAGVDHAGIATQLVVTRELVAQGIEPSELERQEFLDHIWSWKQQSGSRIIHQMKRLAASCDWKRERFTMDADFSDLVIDVFVRLYQEGLIYRGKRIVNWDPKILTALSDLEIVAQEEEGYMYSVRYPLVLSDDEPALDWQNDRELSKRAALVIATTRPETILVDGALVVHPEDQRYQRYIGNQVWVPMTNNKIEVIADRMVDMNFGTGCVKVTAAHDFNDFDVAMRHPEKNIPQLVIFTADAKINENGPERYIGLDRFVARTKIVEDLDKAGLLVQVIPHLYKLPRGDRSGEVLEPMLTDQWFVKADALAKDALESVQSQKITFFPNNWQTVYRNWLVDIRDWCISRQLIWGHRIPAWYDDDNNVYVGRSVEQVRSHYQLAEDLPLRQDEDVLDTWFSSALWPFATLDWPKDNKWLANYFPSSLLVTGFDIIFFWVARMVMMSRYFPKDIPFREVYITGLVRDMKGQKMSKSKGNIIDPLDVIDGIELDDLLAKRMSGIMLDNVRENIQKQTKREYPNGITAHGADALRFTFVAMATHGTDINFDLSRCVGYRNFCNKLWNAARYVKHAVEDFPDADWQAAKQTKESLQRAPADLWLKQRINISLRQVQNSIAEYRFDLVADAVYHLLWDDYCDWYLEISKQTLRSADKGAKCVAALCLLEALEIQLRMMHPIIPFITEEIYSHLKPLFTRFAKLADECHLPHQIVSQDEIQYLMCLSYPEPDPEQITQDIETNLQAQAEFSAVQQIVLCARSLRGELAQSSATQRPQLWLSGVDKDDQAFVNRWKEVLQFLGRLSDVQAVKAEAIEELLINQQIDMSELSTAPNNDTPDAAHIDWKIWIGLQFEVDLVKERERLERLSSKLEKELLPVQNKLASSKFIDNAPAAVVEQAQRREGQLQLQLSQVHIKLKKLK